jgi:hypothetical protein
MIFLERQILLSSYVRSAVIVLLLPIGCAKSQQPKTNTSKTISQADSLDALLWVYDDVPETTRTRFAEFELREVQGMLEDELWGVHEGKDACLIPHTAGRLLEIVAQEDLDGDGWIDLVIGDLGSGKCCPRQFSIVSYRGQGQYHQSKPQGAALHLPMLQKDHGKWAITIENSVLDAYASYKTQEVFAVADGELNRVDLLKPVNLAAIAEMNVATFDTLDKSANIDLSFDLDNDGKLDRITGSYWPQWGRVMWSLAFGNGKVMQDGTPFKRLGILASKTEGFHDLVVDHDRVLTWKGKRYEEQED